MREIKFRFFIKRDNIFVYSDSFSELSEFFKEYEYVYSVTDTYLMQYIGLKDKNRKEIYEGDIVKRLVCYVDSITDKGEIIEEVGVVKFINGCFVVINEKIKQRFSIYNNFTWEILGNIYEGAHK